tara:strand:+ start:671 stop:928 length:258 start_codon:yes stop_codon:yes gene_type:complete
MFIFIGDNMSNQHNEKEFKKIMEQVEELDKQGRLEADIFTYEDRLGYHADDDRDEILFQIAESLFKYGSSLSLVIDKNGVIHDTI